MHDFRIFVTKARSIGENGEERARVGVKREASFQKRNFLRYRCTVSTIRRHEIRRKESSPTDSKWKQMRENRRDVRGAFAFSSRSNDAEREKLKRNTWGGGRGEVRRNVYEETIFRSTTRNWVTGSPSARFSTIRFEAEHTRPPVPPVESVQIFVIATDLLFFTSNLPPFSSRSKF